MSIWMWSMKLRFQIGSKSPLAKRNAKMFCAASLPRKWSMRKTCDSSKVSCTWALRWIALSRSVPNGFSITTREPVDEVGVPEHLDDGQRGLRRDGEVVQTACVVAELSLGLRDGGGQRRRAGRLRDVGEVVVEGVPLLGAQRMGAELLDRGPGERTELDVAHLLQGGADDADVGGELGDDEVGHARQQLAAGQVTGRAEQHHHVRVDALLGVAGRRARLGRIGDRLGLVRRARWLGHPRILPPVRRRAPPQGRWTTVRLSGNVDGSLHVEANNKEATPWSFLA